MKRVFLMMSLTLMLSAFAFGTSLAQDEPAPIPIAIGEEASGEIDGAAVTYVFSATAGQTIIVDVLSEDFEPIAEVNDANGAELAFEFGGDTFASVVFTAPADGDYFFPAGEFMGEGSGAYTVRVREAGALEVGTPISGELNGGTDSYTFQGTAGTLTVLRIETSGVEAGLELIDSEGNQLASDTVFSSGTEAIIEFLLPADGQYRADIPLWFATDVLTGAYTLTLNEIQPTAVEYDAANTVTVEGIDREYFSFAGTTGDVIHILADSGTTEEVEGIDTNLELVGPDGVIITTDNSDGPFADPAITRIILPMDGLYLIKLIPADDAPDQSGDVTLTVETAELLRAEDGTTVSLGERWEQDFVYFEGAPGTTYTLTVTPDRGTVSYSINIGEGLFSSISATIGNGDNLVFTFTVPEDAPAGITGISIRQSSFQNPAGYSISISQ